MITERIPRNKTISLFVAMVDSVTPTAYKTGLTITKSAWYRDGGGFVTGYTLGGAINEIGTTGIYLLDLSAAETNYDYVIINLAGTGALPVLFVFSTYDADDILGLIDANGKSIKKFVTSGLLGSKFDITSGVLSYYDSDGTTLLDSVNLATASSNPIIAGSG